MHIPWCLRKCPYCDFNSHTLVDDLPEASYLDALERDLIYALPQVWGREVVSVFIGGGTPSLLSAEGVDRLLNCVRTLLRLRPGAEITLEANPGTFEAARFRAYRDAGINRLSLGIQSFNDRHLAVLGRIHSAREAHAAVETALALFEDVNLDLMYALPGQGLDTLTADLDTALAYRPPHLSWYHLTIEPNTAFAAKPPELPDDDLAAEMQDLIEARLAAAGYEHYEISAFALRGYRCHHNLNYWTYGDYLGIGAGAHSKLSLPEVIVREVRVKHPRPYMEHAGTPQAIAESRPVPRRDLPFEFMMNALRLVFGFDTALFTERTGLPLSVVTEELAWAKTHGLLTHDTERIRPTERGRRYLNDLLQRFLV